MLEITVRYLASKWTKHWMHVEMGDRDFRLIGEFARIGLFRETRENTVALASRA